MLGDTGFPGRVHFIAHAVRDILDRLPYAMEGAQKGKRVDYACHMDGIVKDWPNIDRFRPHGQCGPPAGMVAIEYDLARRIDRLVKEHRERRKQPSDQELLLRYLMRHEPTGGDPNERVVKTLKAVRNWFMGWAHLRSAAGPTVDEAELQRQFELFEKILYCFVGDFSKTKAEIDDILRDANR